MSDPGPIPVSSREETKKLKAPGDYDADDLEFLFTYHSPEGDEPMRYALLRGEALLMAKKIVECCPRSPSRTVAIQRLRECVMFANAAIALKGRF
jgi:hypothetical protein